MMPVCKFSDLQANVSYEWNSLDSCRKGIFQKSIVFMTLLYLEMDPQIFLDVQILVYIYQDVFGHEFRVSVILAH